MNKLNTTQIGDEFENKTFQLIKASLSNEKLFLPPKLSEIFQKKAYYSKDREAYITTDISIETTLPGADKYSFLTIIECKGYPKNTIQIDEVEEFASKLSQIGGHNTKGVMIANSKYTKTCLTYARNKGIGLIRIIEDEIIHDIYRTSRFGEFDMINDAALVLQGLSTPQKKIYISDKEEFEDISSYLFYLRIIDKKEYPKTAKLNIPFLDEEYIENLCEDLTYGLCDGVEPIDLNRIIKEHNLKLISNTDLGFHQQKSILGKISFKDNLIYISNNLEIDSHRWRFTLAHELGHFFLHKKVLSTIYQEAIDTELSLSNSTLMNLELIKKIEFQANLFASILLMPSEKFKLATYNVFIKHNINRGRLYLDDQSCNLSLFYTVAGQLKEIFKVSTQAIKYRMIKLNLLEGTTARSLKNIFNDKWK